MTCNPLKRLAGADLNAHNKNQNLACYHYTTGEGRAGIYTGPQKGVNKSGRFSLGRVGFQAAGTSPIIDK